MHEQLKHLDWRRIRRRRTRTRDCTYSLIRGGLLFSSGVNITTAMNNNEFCIVHRHCIINIRVYPNLIKAHDWPQLPLAQIIYWPLEGCGHTVPISNKLVIREYKTALVVVIMN